MSVEILPPGRAAIATPTDAVRALARMFPKYGAELAEWAPSYQRALGHLSPERLAGVFHSVVDAWSRSTPPKPADFAASAPSAGVTEQLRSATHLWYVHPDDKRRRCTRDGLDAAKLIKVRMIDDALRMVDEPLTGDEAWRLARSLDDRAWIAAQAEVMEIPHKDTIEITPADIRQVRQSIAADEANPTLKHYARTNGLGAVTAPEPSAAMRAKLDALKAQRTPVLEEAS